MTIEEIEQGLPNGFHDALIKRIEIDYSNRKLRMEIDVDVSNVGDNDIVDKSVILNIYGLIFCAIQPPKDLAYYNSTSEGIWLTGSLSKRPERLSFAVPSPLGLGAFEHYFYISDWNSYIVIVAMDAKLES